jgi:23S rRNA (guanosine2251-2'-O)-methyltransferase
MQFEIWQCVQATCRLRFPALLHEQRAVCPRCGAPTTLILTQTVAPETNDTQSPVGGLVLHALLDNIRSTFNVGSIFRSADGAGLQHLYLCGITPTPDHPKVAKTALGAEQTVAWSQHHNVLDLAHDLKAAGCQLWALEETPAAESLFAHDPLPAQPTVVLIVGNEVTGVDPELLAHCDRILALPMAGIKRSLNVAIAFGIAAYTLRFGYAVRQGRRITAD